MKVPISWLKDFVDMDLPIPELANKLTMAGLEVEEIRFVGLPLPRLDSYVNDSSASGSEGGEWTSGSNVTSGPPRRSDLKRGYYPAISGLEWDPAMIVVASVSEVIPHPNADRLVLCRLNDGLQEHIVLTGAPNLFEYKGKGRLSKPLKVAYAREGARIYDGHQAGQVITTLKRARIRGVDSYSMICSEKELGISDDHEGVILLDDDAPVGVPLVDYMGDAVLDITILPNIARAASILGVAREVAAITGKSLRKPDYSLLAEGAPIGVTGEVRIEIQNPELNPRFVLGLVRDIEIRPSPYQVQRRLRLVGMRPLNNIVDATNYAMLEVGEPLHAFDYDVLVERARQSGADQVTIITRTASSGEHLRTLDGIERILDTSTVLVCDTAGPLSIAGVMGGAESEVSDQTRNVLLEGAAWNFINIRKTARAQNLPSEASYRFSRGVHPAMAERGVRRGLELMRQWADGVVAEGLVDNYPLPPREPVVEVTPGDVERWLGVILTVETIADLLMRLEFTVQIEGQTVRARTPDHRLDIGEGIVGKADLVEEIARVYGYDNIPETRMRDEIPPQVGNPDLDKEERIRDVLVRLGFQELISYRLTHPDREARRLPPDTPPDDKPYLWLKNPIASDRGALRHSVLASVLDIAERNSRLRLRLALFEIGPVFLASEEGEMPDELQRLAIVLAGPRALPGWQSADVAPLDFFDLKGVVTTLLVSLHIPEVHYEPVLHPTFHPGKCARVLCGELQVGVFGELHPLVREHYDWPAGYQNVAILAAELDLDAIRTLTPDRYETQAVPEYPPVLEDMAVVVDETLPSERVAQVIRGAGGKTLCGLRLFDVYVGEQVGVGKKSLAYSLTYQAPDRTLTDKEVVQIRQRIIRRLEQELGAQLRG